MADHPDIYADGIGVGVGPYGLTITLVLSEPTLEAGANETTNVIVGRVRMSHALARALAKNITDTLAQQANILQPPESKTKN